MHNSVDSALAVNSECSLKTDAKPSQTAWHDIKMKVFTKQIDRSDYFMWRNISRISIGNMYASRHLMLKITTEVESGERV